MLKYVFPLIFLFEESFMDEISPLLNSVDDVTV